MKHYFHMNLIYSYLKAIIQNLLNSFISLTFAYTKVIRLPMGFLENNYINPSNIEQTFFETLMYYIHAYELIYTYRGMRVK